MSDINCVIIFLLHCFGFAQDRKTKHLFHGKRLTHGYKLAKYYFT